MAVVCGANLSTYRSIALLVLGLLKCEGAWWWREKNKLDRTDKCGLSLPVGN